MGAHTSPGLWADGLPPQIMGIDTPTLLLYGGIGAGVLLLLIVLMFVFRRGKKKINPERGLTENLADYPPAPGKPGPRRLTLHGHPVRLRLVVVAPVGKKTIAEGGAVEPLLDQVLRGLGTVAQQDKPRIKVWPPQLSKEGFGPTFFRQTRRPEPPGRPSRWILAAGLARAGGQPVLLGLALYADEMTTLEHVPLKETEWDEALRIQKV